MPQGTVKVTVRLTNPEDVWIHEQPVDYPAGAEKAIVLQVLTGIRTIGLIKSTDGGRKVLCIPEQRIVDYVAELITVGLASPNELSQATQAADAGRLIHG